MHNKLNRLDPSISLDVPQHHLSIVFLTAGARGLYSHALTPLTISILYKGRTGPRVTHPSANQPTTP